MLISTLTNTLFKSKVVSAKIIQRIWDNMNLNNESTVSNVLLILVNALTNAN